jgi:molybdopterin molybdotransferase
MAERGLVEVEDARHAIVAAAPGPAGESVALGLAALGRVLGEDVVATHPVPAFDNSAMDGFAVRAPDLAGAGPASPVALRLVGESRAGRPTTAAVGEGQAVAISTGAMMPDGADTVLRVEQAKLAGDVTVQAMDAPEPGRFVRRAGEDVLPGQTVLRTGTLLGPAELGVLASLGRSLIRCVRMPRLSVLVTGDELLGLHEAPRDGAIRDTSTLTISALASCGGAEVVRTDRAGDDPAATREAAARALEGVDIAVVCGGVSVGAHDHVRPSLAELGVREDFWGLALKPGSPAWFGRRDDTLVFGLPGNPVSAMVTFVLLVGPALRTMLGRPAEPERQEAILDRDYSKPAGRAHAVRCRLTVREDGLHATPTGPQGSHVLSSMLGADALAMIPSDATDVPAGSRVLVESLREWTRA